MQSQALLLLDQLLVSPLARVDTRVTHLVQEGARFALLRHMFSNPLHITVMVLAMLLIMAAMMMR